MTELRNYGDSIAGDKIEIQCQKPGTWSLFQKSNQHRGWICIAQKDAKATIVTAYTNVKR